MNRTFRYVLAGTGCLGASVGIVDLTTPFFGNVGMMSVQAQTDSLTEMTVERLDSILQDASRDLQGSDNQWQLTLEGQSILVLADTTHDRMRIVTPVIAADTLSEEQVAAMLLANFHSALDARYAVANGTVVSVFVHPLSTLQEADLRSGLQQVAGLANTFGTTYSSGGLGFGGSSGAQEAVPLREGELEI